MIKTATQLKAKVRNLSGGDSERPLILRGLSDNGERKSRPGGLRGGFCAADSGGDSRVPADEEDSW